jgi:DnaK suppressor protein
VTNTSYEALQEALEARRRELQGDLDVKLREVRSHSVYGGETNGGLDTAENSNAELQQEIDVSLIEMRSEALRRITDTLTRLANGVYGYCAECGGEISEKRLEALPFAVRCRDCEVVYESTKRRSRRIPETRLESLGWRDPDSDE